jgi:hypothetical protein
MWKNEYEWPHRSKIGQGYAASESNLIGKWFTLDLGFTIRDRIPSLYSQFIHVVHRKSFWSSLIAICNSIWLWSASSYCEQWQKNLQKDWRFHTNAYESFHILPYLRVLLWECKSGQLISEIQIPFTLPVSHNELTWLMHCARGA